MDLPFIYWVNAVLLLTCSHIDCALLKGGGFNICKYGIQFSCCPGWTLDESTNLCSNPICRLGCGDGTCVQPDRCQCHDGHMYATCPTQGGSTIYPTGIQPELGCEKLHCSHACRLVYRSPRCLCEPGFRLMHDQSSCSDVDECWERRHQCDHVCVNTVGSYLCTCHPGFMRQLDGRSCRRVHTSVTKQDLTKNRVATVRNSDYKSTTLAPRWLHTYRKPIIRIPYKAMSILPFPSQKVNWVLPNIPELALIRYNNVNFRDKRKNYKISYVDYKIRNRLYLDDHPEKLVGLVLKAMAKNGPMYVPQDVVDEIFANKEQELHPESVAIRDKKVLRGTAMESKGLTEQSIGEKNFGSDNVRRRSYGNSNVKPEIKVITENMVETLKDGKSNEMLTNGNKAFRHWKKTSANKRQIMSDETSKLTRLVNDHVTSRRGKVLNRRRASSKHRRNNLMSLNDKLNKQLKKTRRSRQGRRNKIRLPRIRIRVHRYRSKLGRLGRRQIYRKNKRQHTQDLRSNTHKTDKSQIGSKLRGKAYMKDGPSVASKHCRDDLCMTVAPQPLQCHNGITYENTNKVLACEAFIELDACSEAEVIVVIPKGQRQCFPDKKQLLVIECLSTQVYVLMKGGFACMDLSPGGIIPAICSAGQIARKIETAYVCKDDVSNGGCPENFTPFNAYEGVICVSNEECPVGYVPFIQNKTVNCQIAPVTTTTIRTTTQCPEGQILIVIDHIVKCLDTDSLINFKQTTASALSTTDPTSTTVHTTLRTASRSTYVTPVTTTSKETPATLTTLKSTKTTRKQPPSTTSKTPPNTRKPSHNTSRPSSTTHVQMIPGPLFCPREQERIIKSGRYICQYKRIAIKRKCPIGLKLEYENGRLVCLHAKKTPICPPGSRLTNTQTGNICQKIPRQMGQKCPQNHVLVKMPTEYGSFVCLKPTALVCPQGLDLFYTRHQFECRRYVTSAEAQCESTQYTYTRGKHSFCINKESWKIMLPSDLFCGREDIPVLTPDRAKCIPSIYVLPIVSLVVSLKAHPNRTDKCQFGDIGVWSGDKFLCKKFHGDQTEPCPESFRLIWKTQDNEFLCIGEDDSGRLRVIDPWTRRFVDKENEVQINKQKKVGTIICPFGLVATNTESGVQCHYKKKKKVTDHVTDKFTDKVTKPCLNCAVSKKDNNIHTSNPTKPNFICPSGLIAVKTPIGFECRHLENLHPCRDSNGVHTKCGTNSVNLGCFNGHNFIGRPCHGATHRIYPKQRHYPPNMIPRRESHIFKNDNVCIGNAFQRLFCERKRFRIKEGIERDNSRGRNQPCNRGNLSVNRTVIGCNNYRSSIRAPICRPGFMAIRSSKGTLCVPRVAIKLCGPGLTRNAVVRGKPGCGNLHRRIDPVVMCTNGGTELCKMVTRPLVHRASRSRCEENRMKVRSNNGSLCMPQSRNDGSVGGYKRKTHRIRLKLTPCKIGEKMVKVGSRYECKQMKVQCKPACKGAAMCMGGECVCESGYTGELCDQDVNECYLYKPCSHTCRNTNGSYTCLCPTGHTLGTDRHSCTRDTPRLA